MCTGIRVTRPVYGRLEPHIFEPRKKITESIGHRAQGTEHRTQSTEPQSIEHRGQSRSRRAEEQKWEQEQE